MTLHVGIDLDNTIIRYDGLMAATAIGKGLIVSGKYQGKKALRDHIRSLADGEAKWQDLQKIVYGDAVSRARLFRGVKAALGQLRSLGIRVSIISHKTRMFRRGALGFMKSRGLFSGLYGLGENSVFFESTRREKIGRVIALGCTHLIDDLPEVFAEPDFPPKVRKILFDPGRPCHERHGMLIAGSWRDVGFLILKEAGK